MYFQEVSSTDGLEQLAGTRLALFNHNSFKQISFCLVLTSAQDKTFTNLVKLFRPLSFAGKVTDFNAPLTVSIILNFVTHVNPTVESKKYSHFCSARRKVLTFFLNIFVIISRHTFATSERANEDFHRDILQVNQN